RSGSPCRTEPCSTAASPALTVGHGVESNDIGDGEGRRSTGCVLFCNPNA
ncbi:unnamed protein product, partial [Ascophyllum nodosum]